MSRESIKWLNLNTLIGHTDKRGTAWHRDVTALDGGLDNHYPGAIPVEDVRTRLFNWHAEERSVYVDGGTSGLLLDDSKKAIVRSDNNAILGYHSSGYKPHGYSEWLIENLSEAVGGQAEIANAGLLKKGAVAWVQIEMPENVEMTAGVKIRPFILATTSFDGSIATTYKTGFTNVVCDNTMALFMAEKTEKYKTKHTSNSRFNRFDAATALNTLSLITEQAVAQIESMIAIDVSDSAWQKFVQAHVPIEPTDSKQSVTRAETKRGALTGLWRTDVRVAPWAGTAWGVMQAVNTYNEHMSVIRGVTRSERKMLRAVEDKIVTADRGTVDTLRKVLASA